MSSVFHQQLDESDSLEDNLDFSYRNILLSNDYSSSEEDSQNEEGMTFTSKLNENFDLLAVSLVSENKLLKEMKNKVTINEEQKINIIKKEVRKYRSELNEIERNKDYINNHILFPKEINIKSKNNAPPVERSINLNPILEFNFANKGNKICVSLKTLQKFPNSKIYKITKKLLLKKQENLNENETIKNKEVENLEEEIHNKEKNNLIKSTSPKLVINNNSIQKQDKLSLKEKQEINQKQDNQENISDSKLNKNEAKVQNQLLPKTGSKKANLNIKTEGFITKIEKSTSLNKKDKKEIAPKEEKIKLESKDSFLKKDKQLNSIKESEKDSKDKDLKVHFCTNNKNENETNNNNTLPFPTKQDFSQSEKFSKSSISSSKFYCPNELNKYSNVYPILLVNGSLIVNRKYSSFCNMISYLRTGETFFENEFEEIEFIEELNFWEIEKHHPLFFDSKEINLIKKNKINEKESITRNAFDSNWCANTLSLLNDSYVEKHDGHHGLIFTEKTLGPFNPFIEYSVKIKIASNSSSHLFVGIVNKSVYIKDYLSKLIFFIKI